MRATEIIRNVLDLIDQVECTQQDNAELPVQGMFAQLFSQLSAEPQGYDNSPDPHVHGIESVTTAAGLGGLNGSKQPSDLRADSVSMYPGFQTKDNEK